MSSLEHSEEFPFPEESPAAKETFDKSQKFGWFALTAQDHKNIGSTLDSNNALMHESGKAQYEVMSDAEIEKTLDGALETVTSDNKNLIENGYAQLQKDFLIKSIAFLRSVGRLPEKFNSFDITSLPDFKKPQ